MTTDNGSMVFRVLFFSFLFLTQTAFFNAGFFQKKVVTTCGGTVVGGYCWYYGAVADSCDTTCTTHGGYNSGTETYAGSSGSLANCNALQAIFTGGSNATNFSAAYGFGCYYGIGQRLRASSPATNSTASFALIRRICACNN